MYIYNIYIDIDRNKTLLHLPKTKKLFACMSC